MNVANTREQMVLNLEVKTTLEEVRIQRMLIWIDVRKPTTRR